MVVNIEYGTKTIAVDIEKKDRKNLSVTVHPDLSVTARAPLEYDLTAIKDKLKKRAGWMVKQLDYFEQYHPVQPARQYVSGETQYYLGKQYRLKITQSNRERVRLMGRFFEMELFEPADREKAGQVMKNWYADHARDVIQKRLALFLPLLHRKKITGPEVKFRYMKKRWGSCTGNRLLFNIELVKAPLDCIDYVIVHELCHLVYPNHDKGFYALLKKILPGWEVRKERLEKVVLF